MRTLPFRIAALEKGLLPPPKAGSFFRIVANDGDFDAAVAAAITQGYDPDSNDVCIVRLIAVAPKATESAEEGPQ